jgi:hypothetical protein
MLYGIAAFGIGSRFALTNNSGPWDFPLGMLGMLLTAVTAIILVWLMNKFINPNDLGVRQTFYMICLLLFPVLFLAIGACLVAHQIEWLVGLGAFA